MCVNQGESAIVCAYNLDDRNARREINIQPEGVCCSFREIAELGISPALCWAGEGNYWLWPHDDSTHGSGAGFEGCWALFGGWIKNPKNTQITDVLSIRTL